MEVLTRAFVDLNLWSLFVTICNTLITFLIVKHFLFKPLRKMLAAREQEVRDLYAHAETDPMPSRKRLTSFPTRRSARSAMPSRSLSRQTVRLLSQSSVQRRALSSSARRR